jgi:hypothetical protein
MELRRGSTLYGPAEPTIEELRGNVIDLNQGADLLHSLLAESSNCAL